MHDAKNAIAVQLITVAFPHIQVVTFLVFTLCAISATFSHVTMTA